MFKKEIKLLSVTKKIDAFVCVDRRHYFYLEPKFFVKKGISSEYFAEQFLTAQNGHKQLDIVFEDWDKLLKFLKLHRSLYEGTIEHKNLGNILKTIQSDSLISDWKIKCTANMYLDPENISKLIDIITDNVPKYKAEFAHLKVRAENNDIGYCGYL